MHPSPIDTIERASIQRQLAAIEADWEELKSELGRKYDGQPRTAIGRYDFGKLGRAMPVPKLPGPIGVAVSAGVALFEALVGRNDRDGAAVMEFRARKFTGDATGAIDLVGARELTRDEVNAACPRYEEVQRRLDAIVDAVRSDNTLLSGANFGTRVHARLEAEIKTLADPNLKSEVSVLMGEEVRRGRPGSKRIDVYERPQAAIVCTHDMKTEKAISHRGADSRTCKQRMEGLSGHEAGITQVRPRDDYGGASQGCCQAASRT